MWILLLYTILGILSPGHVYCQTGSSGSSIQWQANLGGSSTGGPSKKLHTSSISWKRYKAPEIPTTINSENTVRSKTPMKFSREFLKLLAGTNELGPLRSRVWTTTTTTTERPPPPPPTTQLAALPWENTKKNSNVIPPPPKQLTDGISIPPPPFPTDSNRGDSNFQVGKRNQVDSIDVLIESNNGLSNGVFSTNKYTKSTNTLTNGNGATTDAGQKQKNDKPKTHSRKQSVGDIQPVPHIGEKIRSQPRLAGGMSLFDIVNSKPGFEDYVRLSKEGGTTVYTKIYNTKTTKSTMTKAPARPPHQTTTITTTTAATTPPQVRSPTSTATVKSDPVFMVQSSLSQPLQFAEQLRQQGVEVIDVTDLGKGGLQIGKFNIDSSFNPEDQIRSKHKEIITQKTNEPKQRTLAPRWPPPFMESRWPTLSPIWGYQSTPYPKLSNDHSNAISLISKASGKRIKSWIENMYKIVNIADSNYIENKHDLNKPPAFNIGKLENVIKDTQSGIKTVDISTNSLLVPETQARLESAIGVKTMQNSNKVDFPQLQSSTIQLIPREDVTTASSSFVETKQANKAEEKQAYRTPEQELYININTTQRPFTSFMTEMSPSTKTEQTTDLKSTSAYQLVDSATSNSRTNIGAPSVSTQQYQSTEYTEKTTTPSFMDFLSNPVKSTASTKQSVGRTNKEHKVTTTTTDINLSLPTTTLKYVEARPGVYDQQESNARIRGIPIPMDIMQYDSMATSDNINQTRTVITENTNKVEIAMSIPEVYVEQNTKEVTLPHTMVETGSSTGTITSVKPINTEVLHNDTYAELLLNATTTVNPERGTNPASLLVSESTMGTSESNATDAIDATVTVTQIPNKNPFEISSDNNIINDFIGATILLNEWKKPGASESQVTNSMTFNSTLKDNITVNDIPYEENKSITELPNIEISFSDTDLSNTVENKPTESIFVNGSFVRTWKHIGDVETAKTSGDETSLAQKSRSDTTTLGKQITRKPRATLEQRAMMTKLVDMLTELKLFFSRDSKKGKLPFRLHDASGKSNENKKKNSKLKVKAKTNVTNKDNTTSDESYQTLNNNANNAKVNNVSPTTPVTETTSTASGTISTTADKATTTSKATSSTTYIDNQQSTGKTHAEASFTDATNLEQALQLEIRQKMNHDIATIGNLPRQITTSGVAKETTYQTQNKQANLPDVTSLRELNSIQTHVSSNKGFITTPMTNSVKDIISMQQDRVLQGTSPLSPIRIVEGLSPMLPENVDNPGTSTSSSSITVYTQPLEEAMTGSTRTAAARITLPTVDAISASMSPKEGMLPFKVEPTESIYISPHTGMTSTDILHGSSTRTQLLFNTNKGPPPSWLFDDPSQSTTPAPDLPSFIQTTMPQGPSDAAAGGLTGLSNGGMSTSSGMTPSDQMSQVMTIGLRSQNPTASSDVSSGGNTMDALLAQLRGSSGQQSSNTLTSSQGMNQQRGNRNNKKQSSNKRGMAAFLETLSPDQKRALYGLLGGKPPTTTPVPTTTTPRPEPEIAPSILKLMKAMGQHGLSQGPGPQANQGPGPGPNDGPPQFDGLFNGFPGLNHGLGPRPHQGPGPGPNLGPPHFAGPMNGQNELNQRSGPGPNNGPPKFDGPMRGIGQGGNRGGNRGGNGGGNRGGNGGGNRGGNGGNRGNNGGNRGGNRGGPFAQGNNGGGRGGGGNSGTGNGGGGGLGMFGMANNPAAGLASLFGEGASSSGPGLGGPDMNQMMAMLSGGSGGGGEANPLSALMGMGPMGGMMGNQGGGRGRGNMRGQRRMMPGGPNADPATRRMLMNRLLRRGRRPGMDPADPPEPSALGEGMMGGGGMAGLFGGAMNPSTAWMGGGGGAGGGGAGAGEGAGGLAGMMSMFGGGGGAGAEGMAGAGGLGALMGGAGGEGAMNPMMLSLLAGGDPADMPPVRGMGGPMGGGLRGFGGMPALKRREAGPGPKPNKTLVASTTKSKSSSPSKNSKDIIINSNAPSSFSYSVARKILNNRRKLVTVPEKKVDKSNKNKSQKIQSTGISLVGKNSKALVEFISLDLLPKHLLPKLKSLDVMKPKHRRRPSPQLSTSKSSKTSSRLNNTSASGSLSNLEVHKLSTNKEYKSSSIDKSGTNVTQINSPNINVNGNNGSKLDATISIQKRFSRYPLRTPFDPKRRFKSFGDSVSTRWDKHRSSLGSPAPPNQGKGNTNPKSKTVNPIDIYQSQRSWQGRSASWAQSNSKTTPIWPQKDTFNKKKGTPSASSSTNQPGGSKGWKPPPNVVVNSPGMPGNPPTIWTQSNGPSNGGFPQTNSWQTAQRRFDSPRPQWNNNQMSPPSPRPMPPPPRSWHQTSRERSWGPPSLPRSQMNQGPSLPKTRQPPKRQPRQWASQSNSQQWSPSQYNPRPQPNNWRSNSNTQRQLQTPSQGNQPQYAYTPPPPTTVRPINTAPWRPVQNNYPPRSTRRPWQNTQRPWQNTQRSWQTRPPYPPTTVSNQFGNSRQTSHVNPGQSGWVEFKPNSRKKSQFWNGGQSNGPLSNNGKGQQKASFNQNFPRKQPNAIDNTQTNFGQKPYMDHSNNKVAFGQPVTKPPPTVTPKATVAPTAAPWNSGSQRQNVNPYTQAPPPPQWQVPGKRPSKTTVAQTAQTQQWNAPNQQTQAWTDRPQFGGAQQRTTTDIPMLRTEPWKTATNQFGGQNSNSQFGGTNSGGGTNSFQSNQNFGSPTVTPQYNNNNMNQNIGGPTTHSSFMPQHFGSPNGVSSNFGTGTGLNTNGMLDLFAGRRVSGPGIPPIQADHISDIMGGGPGLAAAMPPDIKLMAARMSLAGQTGDNIADVLGAEMRRRRRLGLVGGRMGAAALG